MERTNMAQNEEIRQAAETLLTSASYNLQSPRGFDISHSHSINTIPSLNPDYIISEDLLAGQRFQGGMSNVRRFFCLFVTFDFLFTSLMWIICVMLDGENITKAISEQIYHYNIHTSLFDIVLAAFCRFIVLLVFYALIYINHWIVISMSTTLTCIFLITKVFFYDWPHSTQPVFEVLLVLTSFVLSWGEAWFLDFRVLPQESHAQRYLITNTDSERAPLIQSYIHGLPSMYTESVGAFYSPMASPDGSIYRFNQTNMGRFPAVQLTREQEEMYKNLAARTVQEAWDLLNRNDWKLEKQIESDQIYTMNLSRIGTIFKLVAIVDAAPRVLLDELFYRVDSMPQWNSALLESHKVQIIDEHTDITYQISADGAGGLVKSRDFVNLRCWQYIDGAYIIANVATEHPSLPKFDKFIRGENRAGCWVMSPIADNPNQCSFQWVLNTNLKGYLVKAVTHNGFINMMFKYVEEMRLHLNDIKESERLF